MLLPFLLALKKQLLNILNKANDRSEWSEHVTKVYGCNPNNGLEWIWGTERNFIRGCCVVYRDSIN